MVKATDPAAALREQFFSSIKQGQDLTLSTLGTWWGLTSKAVPTPQLDSLPLGDTLPKPAELIDASFGFFEELLATQKDSRPSSSPRSRPERTRNDLCHTPDLHPPAGPGCDATRLVSDPPRGLEALGGFVRAQRQLANLSLRQMAELADISNPYLSQVERGLHEPSVRVLQSIAQALNLSAETLLAQAGLLRDRPAHETDDGQATELAIRRDPRLRDEQKQALLSVYRSYLAANEA